MLRPLLLLSCLVMICFSAMPSQRPIIGILTQEDQDDPYRGTNSATFQTMITASYIKYVQMSGAQVVPIFAYSPQSEIAALLPKLNGVLFPGGQTDFDMNTRWTQNANFIFQWAKQQNDAGNVFPIWGTCLGHQLLLYLSNDGDTPLVTVHGQQRILNTIKFTSTDRGAIWNDLPERIVTKFTTGQGIVYYNHEEAVLSEKYNSTKKLSDFWKVIGQTTSPANETFLAVIQARNYPFYGVQFHPQKSIFEWKVFSDKQQDSVRLSQIISNRFMQKARQSKNQFASFQQFSKLAIYNYNTYTTVMSFTRIYIFNETKPAQQFQRLNGMSKKLKLNQLYQ